MTTPNIVEVEAHARDCPTHHVGAVVHVDVTTGQCTGCGKRVSIAKTKERRGFALLPKDKHLEIARRGAASMHARHGKHFGHKFTKETAAVAGKKGALALATKLREKREGKEGQSS